jgi:exodeoxyribonuclease VII small subunit
MKKTVSNEINYKDLKTELDSILFSLQSDTIDVDESLIKYERGREIINLLTDYLKNAENSITKINAK